jgi:branched-chain amino acid transport system permease protein
MMSAAGYWEHIAIMAGTNAILALGFYLTLLTGQLSAAHAAFVGVGGYIAGGLAVKAGMSFYPTIAVAAAAAGIVSAVLALLLQRLSGMFFAIATLGFSEMLVVILKNNNYLGGALGLVGVPLRTTLWHVLTVLALLTYGFVQLEHSRFGVAFRAVRDDPIAAAASGINVMHARAIAFIIGAVICGLGGALQVHYLGVMEPDDLAFHLTVSLLLFTVVGGRDYFVGPIVGAAIFTLLPELLRITHRGRLVVFSLLLIVIVIVRPEGILGRYTLKRWWERLSGKASRKPLSQSPMN